MPAATQSMNGTATARDHLALPSDEELDAAREALEGAINALSEVSFRLACFFDLQEAAGGGMRFASSHNAAIQTFDVPTLDRIGALFLFASDVERKLVELEEQYECDSVLLTPSLRERIDWLDVVRTRGGDARVVEREAA